MTARMRFMQPSEMVIMMKKKMKTIKTAVQESVRMK